MEALFYGEKHMAQKKGAGGKPQTYDEATGRYGSSSATPAELLRLKELGIEEDVIRLPDEVIPRSLSARWANYDIAMPDGSVAHFVEGTKLHHIEVFAGKGTRTPIRDVDRLVRTYGGKAEDWQKVKGIGTIEVNGKSFEAEVHWYQEPNIGKVEWKSKDQ